VPRGSQHLEYHAKQFIARRSGQLDRVRPDLLRAFHWPTRGLFGTVIRRAWRNIPPLGDGTHDALVVVIGSALTPRWLRTGSRMARQGEHSHHLRWATGSSDGSPSNVSRQRPHLRVGTGGCSPRARSFASTTNSSTPSTFRGLASGMAAPLVGLRRGVGPPRQAAGTAWVNEASLPSRDLIHAITRSFCPRVVESIAS
jgi:hypothetical protein